jgi:hypothetical protein
MESDMIRRQAIAELLAIPDTPDLRRGHRITVEGRPDRYRQISYLASVFIHTKLVALHERDSVADGAGLSETRSCASSRRPSAPPTSSLAVGIPARAF